MVSSMKTQPPNRWLAAAMIAWTVLAVAASVKTVIDPESHTVYTAFSHGSRDWWDGNSLYIDRAYYYSPTFAIAMTPLAIWPDWYGGVLWNFVSVGLLAWSLQVFYRRVLATAGEAASVVRSAPPRPKADDQPDLPETATYAPRDILPFPSTELRSPAPAEPVAQRTEALFHILVLIGSVRSIWSGQSNAILMALVLFAGAAIVERKWWRASLLFAAPIYIKIWPLVIAGLFAIQRPKRLALRLAICVAALGLLPFLTKNPTAAVDSYMQWGEGLVNRQATQFRFTGYRDAWTIWEQFQSKVDKRAYFIVQVAAGLATLAWCVWQSRRERLEQQLIFCTIAAWSAWQLLFGPGTERLTYNLIAPALAWAMIRSFQTGRDRVWITLTYLMTFLLGLGGVERMLVGIFPAATAFEPIGVLMFAGWLVWTAARPDRPSTKGDELVETLPVRLLSRAA